jgi:hypothetical protein
MTTFSRFQAWRNIDDGLRYEPEGCKPRHPKDYTLEGARQEATAVREFQDGAAQSRNQILFPMLVGAIFVAVLVVGALFG